MRLVAAFFPSYRLQVALRACPLGKGSVPAFAVADSVVAPTGRREAPSGATLLEVSAAAREAGVRPGMTVASARAICPGIVVRPMDPAAHEAARIAIAEVLSGFGPRVEMDESLATGFADITGVRAGEEGLTQEEAALSRTLSAQLTRAGFRARVACTSSRFAARTIAAFGRARIRVIAAGDEPAALAPLPIAALPLDPLAAEALPRLGLTTLGQIAALPGDALARRFGAAAPGAGAFRRAPGRIPTSRDGAGAAPASRWAALARGEDPTPLAPFRLPDALFEKIDLPSPVAELEALLFPAKTLLDRLCARLLARGRAAAKLALHLVLEEWDRPAPAITVELRLPRPTAQPRTILEVARERMSRLQLPGPVREMAIELVDAVDTRRTQLSLFEKAPPAPEKLAATLGRLASAFGAAAVFAARAADEHRPERAFAPDALSSSPVPLPIPLPAPDDLIRPLRLLPAPEPIAFQPGIGARPAELLVRGARLPIFTMQGPERLSGDWWNSPYDRDYYLASTDDGSRWWIFHDRGAHTWHLHGLFD